MFEHIKSNKKIAIIDANNFYCSCERLFDPQFDTKPTVVLSNNDGCIMTRRDFLSKNYTTSWEELPLAF